MRFKQNTSINCCEQAGGRYSSDAGEGVESRCDVKARGRAGNSSALRGRTGSFRWVFSVVLVTLVVYSEGDADTSSFAIARNPVVAPFLGARRGKGVRPRRYFDGDNIGDGKTYGDQYTGSLLTEAAGGDVYSWGLNDFGQLGDGSREDTFQPVLCPVLRGKNITWLSAGESHSLAINQDGIVFSWGRNHRGQLGLSDASLSACSHPSIQSNCDGTRPDEMWFPMSITDLLGDRVLMASSRGNSNLAVTKRVITFGWGENGLGQIGSGDSTDRNIPTQMESSLQIRFVLVAMGGEHAMGVTPLGEVYVWGSNSYGQLGQDTLGMGPTPGGTQQSDLPLVVPGLKGKMVVKIAAGWAHCIVLTDNGETWVWGRNNYGQLGLGDKSDRYKPERVQTGSGRGHIIGFVTEIAAGHSHSIWLNSSGIPFTAGRNDAGQLGVYNSIDRDYVTKVIIPKRIWCDTPFGSEISQSFQDWVCVGSASRDQCGQRCKGTLLRQDCGAKNATAGLTLDDCEPLMPISQNIIKIAAGDYMSYAISDDYNLYAWGSNTMGQIGIGDPSLWGRFIFGPQLVVSLYGKNVSTVAGGNAHTIAKAYREPLYIYDVSPRGGATAGGTRIYVIGQGFNTFVGNLTCLMSYFTNGTHASRYPNQVLNAVREDISMAAEKYSNVRLRCVAPDVRYKLQDGKLDLVKMASSESLLVPRNLTILLNGIKLETLGELAFQYTGLPGITGIVPEGGPITGNTYILIQGYNFDKALSTDVRVRFGDDGDNWMRGCILTPNLIVTVAPPTGPSDSGILDFDGACNDICPDGFDIGCFCSSVTDDSPSCVKGIVRASVDPLNRASRRDRCKQCAKIVGPVDVRIALNGVDYSQDTVTFTYFESPAFEYATAPPWIAKPEWIARKDVLYGGPTGGGTTIDIRGVGTSPAVSGSAVCAFGCTYSDQGNSIGPKCTPGTSRHSLPLYGMFTGPNTYVFDQPAPNAVWDIIHFGTWFMCAGTYDTSGCNTYDYATRTLRFAPAYEPDYAPTFRGYNASTYVITSCIEDCESRIEYVGEGLLRCISPPKQLQPGAANETVTLRIKLNGQDIYPTCFTYSCNDWEPGALQFVYYAQPKITTLAPNGGPLMDRSFIFVTGSGFRNFAWYPQCLFGRQTAMRIRNSTTFPGWVTNKFKTNTSAYVISDTLLVCYATELPPNAPQLLDEEAGRRIHSHILGALFSGADGDPETFADNIITAGGVGGPQSVPTAFSITLNSQDWVNSPGISFPFNQAPGTILEPTDIKFIYYPHPILKLSVPLGGPDYGRSKLLLTGVGLSAFNEMSRWRGQLDPLVKDVKCDLACVANCTTCLKPFWYYGALNPSWFNDTSSTSRPLYVPSEALGWPQNDRNIINQYPPTTSTSIRCRFGDASVTGSKTQVHDPFWGSLVRYEPVYLKSVYADFLDNSTLRCTTPGDLPGKYFLEVSLNGREYSSQGVLPYTYYREPETHKLAPSGGQMEGGTTITVTALGLTRYTEIPICRFGREAFYDSKFDIFLAITTTTSVATIFNDTMLTCKTPIRFSPINAPFSISVNGQDYNFEQARCHISNPDQTMWNDPANPTEIIPATVNYSHPFTQQSLISTCPFVYYRHPTIFALEPAGGPITGDSDVRVFGRGFSIFYENVRCKFGDTVTTWVQAHGRDIGKVGRDEEVRCFTTPKLMLALRGSDVSCTFACIAFPDDPQRCDFAACSIWHPAKLRALKLTIAEIVGVRDVYGDIDVSPDDIVIETIKQPRDPFNRPGAPSVDVVFCVRCVQQFVTQSNVDDANKIIEATRKGVLLTWFKEYGLQNIEFMEISAEPAPIAISLNGQDYTYQANALYTFYMAPTIFGIAPSGGPLIRYDIAEAKYKDPTQVEVGGIGMRNYDEKAQCRFGDLVVEATVIGDSLMLCQTPWPGILFREGFCDTISGAGCVLDVWVEVSLNGFDFTIDSKVNFRYYQQPQFPTFSPLGGPVDGGTLVTFFGKGFNRFNDGSLRIQWGFHRSFPEEDIGETLLSDDFDPNPEEVLPLEDEYGVLTQAQILDLNGTESKVVAPDFDKARALLLGQYKFDKTQWDFDSAVGSNARCGAMDLPSTMAKIDVGYLPGNFSTSRDDIQSRSLYFTGQSAGVLAGRLIISKTVDLSRGGAVSMWLKRGNASAPLACERPDVRDELSLSLKPELGFIYMRADCLEESSLSSTSSCDGESKFSLSLCNVSETFAVTQTNAVQVNRSKEYIMNQRTVKVTSYLNPRCEPSHDWVANVSSKNTFAVVDSTDQTHFRLGFTYYPNGLDFPPSEAICLVPKDRVVSPRPGDNETFVFQSCHCVPVFGCPIPPCVDSCVCHVIEGSNCSLNGVTSSVAYANVEKKRSLWCTLPRGTKPNKFEVLIVLEYFADSSPPTWNQMQRWRRMRVYDTNEFEEFSFSAQSLYANQRGVRNGVNRNELTTSKSDTSMVRCPRHQACYNWKSRVMLKQNVHGQGDFDAWAIDDFKAQGKGGIIDDTMILARAPPAKLSIPLQNTEELSWQKDGKLTGAYIKGIDIYIAMNNQTYEQAGKMNFCRYAGDSKADGDDQSKIISCNVQYFNWDEPNWLFQTSVRPLYTNWWEKLATTNWGEVPRFFTATSQQFNYYQQPTVTGLAPSGGPIIGGTGVTVLGSGFSVFSDPIRTPKCKFGGTVVEARVDDDERMFCITPDTLQPGYVSVTVSLNEVDFTSPAMGRQYSIPFLFYNPPEVTSLVPPTGPSRGGTLIFVIGTGFLQLPSAPACRFIGINDPSVIMDVPGKFLNDTLIQCVAPAVADLCTPKHYCKAAVNTDPNWRGCVPWRTCPYVGQCEETTCGCPVGPRCLQLEEDGSKVTRDQVGEEVLFDMAVQVSLNGICCLRDGKGRILDGCPKCVEPNQRCGCIGDFTDVEATQDSTAQNTYTYYREAELDFNEIMKVGRPPCDSGDCHNPINEPSVGEEFSMVNGNTKPIRLIGKYIRNTTNLQCVFAAKCHQITECDPPPLEIIPNIFGSYFFMDTNLVLCRVPEFWGQPWESQGRAQLFLSLNGIDHTNFCNDGKDNKLCTGNGDCPLIGCIFFQYNTPMSPSKVRAIVLGITISMTLTMAYIAIQRQRYLKKNAKYVADTGGEWEKPSLREAVLWQSERQVRKYGTQNYPLWKTGSAELGQLGVGVGLYFEYLKYMLRYFTIMSAMALPSMALCNAGVAFKFLEVDIGIRLSLGNIGLGWEPNVLEFICFAEKCAGGVTLTSRDASLILAIADCAIMLVFIFATWRLKIFQEKAIIAIDEDTITASDYSVLVEGIPKDATDPDEIRAFFSRYGEVADVAIGLNNGRLISLFQKRGLLEIEVEEMVAKLKLQKLQTLQQILKKMRKQQQKLDAKIVALRAKTDFKAVVAYVTFNEESGQEECLESYSFSLFARLMGKQKGKVKTFRGRYHLRVTQAPEPSNVLWENLQHRGFETQVRAGIANLITVIMLLGSFAIVIAVKAIQESLQVDGGQLVCLSGPDIDAYDVQEQIVWAKYSQTTAGTGTALYQTYLECYCAPNLGNMVDKEPEFCADYISNQRVLLTLSIASVAVVVGINGILQSVLKALAGTLEKPHTISAWEKGIASRIFIAQWINTGLLITIVNADWKYHLPVIRGTLIGGAFTGKFKDFEEGWYTTVGTALVRQSATAALSPNIAVLAQWPLNIVMQTALKNRQLTQRKLNTLFEGAVFLLSKRYGALLNILFVILTYASALPLLYFFGILFFSSAYWCDKIAVLRAMKRPAQYDEKLAFFSTLMMSFGIFIHLAFGVWFYAYVDGDVLNELTPIFELVFRERFFTKRLVKKPAFVVFCTLLFFIIFELFARTIGPSIVKQLMQAIRGTQEEVKEGNPSFFEALENQEISGLDTYNIKKNPRYRDAFQSEIATDVGAESDSEDDNVDDFGDDDD